jgi:hypothetical protein
VGGEPVVGGCVVGVTRCWVLRDRAAPLVWGVFWFALVVRPLVVLIPLPPVGVGLVRA